MTAEELQNLILISVPSRSSSSLSGMVHQIVGH